MTIPPDPANEPPEKLPAPVLLNDEAAQKDEPPAVVVKKTDYENSLHALLKKPGTDT